MLSNYEERPRDLTHLLEGGHGATKSYNLLMYSWPYLTANVETEYKGLRKSEITHSNSHGKDYLYIYTRFRLQRVHNAPSRRVGVVQVKLSAG
jgi:hypothetical protein